MAELLSPIFWVTHDLELGNGSCCVSLFVWCSRRNAGRGDETSFRANSQRMYTAETQKKKVTLSFSIQLLLISDFINKKSVWHRCHPHSFRRRCHHQWLRQRCRPFPVHRHRPFREVRDYLMMAIGGIIPHHIIGRGATAQPAKNESRCGCDFFDAVHWGKINISPATPSPRT